MHFLLRFAEYFEFESIILRFEEIAADITSHLFQIFKEFDGTINLETNWMCNMGYFNFNFSKKFREKPLFTNNKVLPTHKGGIRWSMFNSAINWTKIKCIEGTINFITTVYPKKLFWISTAQKVQKQFERQSYKSSIVLKDRIILEFLDGALLYWSKLL